MPEPSDPTDGELDELAALLALGGDAALSVQERRIVAAHADDPAFRARVEDFARVVDHLPDAPPSEDTMDDPPPRLRARVLGAVADEQRPRPGRWVASGVAAVAAVLLGVAIGRVTVPTPPAPPIETIALDVAGFDATSAEVIAHTWGTELLFAFDGTTSGESYTVTVTGTDGTVLAAGSFLGDAQRTVDCEMNVALLREDAAAFEITDAAGAVVVAGDLPPLVALDA